MDLVLNVESELTVVLKDGMTGFVFTGNIILKIYTT
jgi:hypothetical protein